MRHLLSLFVVAAMATLLGCGDAADTQDAPVTTGTVAEARELLMGLLNAESPEKGQELSMALQGTEADYASMFQAPLAEDLRGMHAGLWSSKPIIGPKTGQTELLLFSATTEELQSRTGDADKFPGGYERVAAMLQGGVRWFRFKFVKPGETSGMAFDGLAHVNGHWVLTPKPWRAMKDPEDG